MRDAVELLTTRKANMNSDFPQGFVGKISQGAALTISPRHAHVMEKLHISLILAIWMR